jgi:hypothetical protein
MANTSNRGDAREQAQQAGSEAKQAASGLTQKAQDTAANLTEKAREVASNVTQRAGNLAEAAGDRADDALSSMGQRMTNVASSLRQSAPRSGVVGSAADTVANTLESGGRYLQEHGVGDMTEDLAGVIRRNPLPALCLAFGVGFLIGMASRR